jgi:hypothetical protein
MAGKRLEDLNLSDTPLPTPSKPLDPRDSDWYRFSRAIDDLLATGTYTWAQDTLHGIQESVEKTEVVTEGQRRAVANIEGAGEERMRGRSRRYEGFRRG